MSPTGNKNRINTNEISKTNPPWRDAHCRDYGGRAFRPSTSANDRHARFTRRDDNGRISMTLLILQYCSGKQELLTACWRLRCNFHLS